MTNKLSYSQVRLYSDCGQRYKYHYVNKLREKYAHSALLFGSAIDEALNTLLLTRDKEKAHAEFDKKWAFQYITDKVQSVSDNPLLVYAATDFDEELLTAEDTTKIQTLFKEKGISESISDYTKKFLEDKANNGFSNIPVERRKVYNYINWLSLRRKGKIFIESYDDQVMPRIKRVIAVQDKAAIANGDGDEVTFVIDLVAELDDGTIALLDNKTSAREYDQDQAARSQQLIFYYFATKEKYNLNKIGFIVMNKQIRKNRIKICSSCGNDGTGGRAKTCDAETPHPEGKKPIRCGAEWLESINPKAYIQFILSDVTPAAEDLVVSAFDETNNAIKQGIFYKNLNNCKSGNLICPYYNYCWRGNKDDLIQK
jgi:hypothetical protein